MEKLIEQLTEMGRQFSEVLNELAKHAAHERSEPVEKAEWDESLGLAPMRNMHPDERLSSLMEELCEQTGQRGDTGLITYLGVFSSGGRQSNWIRNQVSANALLPLIESGAVATVLSCIGSQDRLKVLLALLKKPSSVAQLTEMLRFGSTGQVYHHLKALLNANLVKEDEHERGLYSVVPHRVQGIIMILAGISDILDPKFSTGAWE